MKKQKWEESEKRRERVRRKGQPETCATPGKSATGLRGCRRPRKSKEVITSSNSSSLSPWSYLLKHNVLQLCDTLKCLYPIPFWWATKTGSEKAKPHANRVWKKYEWRISGLKPGKKTQLSKFRVSVQDKHTFGILWHAFSRAPEHNTSDWGFRWATHQTAKAKDSTGTLSPTTCSSK